MDEQTAKAILQQLMNIANELHQANSNLQQIASQIRRSSS